MTLDLVIRGAGSSRRPEEHLAAVTPEYPGCQILLYGQTAEVPGAVRVAAEPDALAEALKSETGETTLVYGDESLLGQGHALSPGIIWVALASDANGVREVWRLRQQYGWLTGKKLGLLVERSDESAEPDLERMMRLSRAGRAVVVPSTPAAESQAGDTDQPAEEPTSVSEAGEEPAVPAVGPEPAEASDAAAAEMAGAEDDTEPEAASAATAVAEDAVPPTQITMAAASAFSEESDHNPTEGAKTTMLENNIELAPEASTPASTSAEQALIQRYTLVKERRSTAARIAEVESTMQNLLKEIFVSRFAAGPEAAAAFEQLATKLAEASGEFTQLSKTMARIEAGLAQLAWVKDELEI